MSDPRIVEYLRLNMGKYPVDALKAALVKQGFPAADVDDAAAQASGGAPPPPPSLDDDGRGTPSGDAVVFGLGNAVANALALFKDPEGFFSRFDREASYGPAVVHIMFWGAVSGVLTLLLAFVKPAPFGTLAAGLQIVILPVMGALISWLGAGIFHVICLILGGKGPFKQSYQVIASMAAMFPISTLLGAVPFGTVPVQLYGLYLSVTAAGAVHGVAKARAWIVFGIFTGLGILGSIFAHIGMANFRQPGLAGFSVPGGAPQALPPEAAQMLSQLGGQMTPDAQKAMQDAIQNPMAIVQELTRYGNLAEPPAETLALLDDAARARLAKSWPQLSAPMRKSLIETLPSVPAAERGAFMDQMDAYTKDINATLNQSMQLMQQAQQAMEQQNKK